MVMSILLYKEVTMTKRELMDMLENIAKDYVKTAKISLECAKNTVKI